MQDPFALYSQIKAQVHPPQNSHLFPEQENLKCPRCDSTNTKFCYFNNYNLSQPRHFCKSCRRYWTKGGALRNVPVGGGSRKNTKRSSKTETKTSKEGGGIPIPTSPATPPPKRDQFSGYLGKLTEGTQSLGSSNGHFLNGPGPSGLTMVHFSDQNRRDLPPQSHLVLDTGSSNDDGFLNIHGECWGGATSSTWPDLDIYTPGSAFH